MTNTKSHAKREFDILEKTIPDAIIAPFKKEILALCEAFGKSGQSGGSAPFTAKAISNAVDKLLMYETLAPLTGEEDEWIDVSETDDGEIMFQNIRDSRVFKDGKNGKAYFIDAIVFDGDVGGRFTGNNIPSKKYGNVGSLQYIKSFPFKPKTFYIDVIDQRWKDGYIIQDEEQLKEVFEYYDKKEIS